MPQPNIDRLHQENLQFLKTLPYRYNWAEISQAQAGSNNNPFAHLFERLLAESLRRQGYQVELTPNNHPFDLWLGRGRQTIRVEIKAANPYYTQAIRTWRYQAAIRNRQTDLLIFVCLFDFDQVHHFIIPKAALGRHRNITITSRDPRDYRGQWAPYLDAWQFIDETLAAVPARPPQPSIGALQ